MLFAGSASLEAQPVLLQIRPRVGDTFVVKLDQKVQMTGTPVDCHADVGSSIRETPCSSASRHMTTATEVFSRAIVTGKSGDAVLVDAVTDSIRVATRSGANPGKLRRVRSRNASMALRLGTDGGAEVVNSDATDELRSLFGQMPAMLSGKAVAVGGKWSREMRIPIVGEAGAMGLVRASFQLDSLGKNGDIAYVSMRGTLTHDHRDGSDSELDGSMKGSMQIDRRLSWITYTHAEIDVTSSVRKATTGEAMRVRTRISQYLKAAPAR